MKSTALACLGLLLTSAAQAKKPPANARPSGPLQQKIAPGLATYTDEVLYGRVWPRPDLSPRDRSLVVITVLIATNKATQLEGHLGRALDNGVTPVEASGVLTHLALYAGWPSAVSALDVFDRVYGARDVDLETLKTQDPGIVDDVVLDHLWRRSDLSVRDRSLVTIAALAAMGDAELLEPDLRRGIDAGLTRAEIEEALTQLAFYAGWGKAMAAMTQVTRALDAGATLTISRDGTRTPTNGSPEKFTGAVRVDPLFQPLGDGRTSAAQVTFEPGARSAWHSHPLGQTLVVTAGVGRVQAWGGPLEEIRPGDVVWTPPGVKHWHGAAPDVAMTHIAIQEQADGKVVEWMEQVTDAEYAAPTVKHD